MVDWGADLWDQYDAIAIHTQKGIDFLDRFSQFYKERCAVELKYARDLKNLVKNFQPKKKDDEDNQFSYFRGFNRMSCEVHDLAAQHERLAEELQTTIVFRVQTNAKDLREDRRRYLDEANRIQKNLEVFIQQLEKAKRLYEKAFKESQRAQETYARADENQELSRKAVEDARMGARRKTEEFEVAKQDYAAKLQETNQFQRNFYQSLMPNVFQRMQEVDQRKSAQIRDSVIQAVEIERKIQPIIDKCLEEMIKSAQEVSPQFDSQIVVDRYKSGLMHPMDIPFWNLEDGKSVDGGTLSHHYPPIRSESMRGTQSQNNTKNRKGLKDIFPGKTKDSGKEDFSELPPHQRKKKVQQGIDKINQQMSQETLTRDALMKMRGVYEANPSMGDPNSVNGQLSENSAKLELLRQELARLQVYLDEAEQSIQTHGQPRQSIGSQISAGNLSANQRGSADSLATSRSPSESSIPGPHATSTGVAPLSSSLPNGENDDLYEPAPGETEEIVGTCLALYQFEGQSEGALSVAENEELFILEMDQGDGWTHVRRMGGGHEGFVPTSYIQCTLYTPNNNHNNHHYST